MNTEQRSRLGREAAVLAEPDTGRRDEARTPTPRAAVEEEGSSSGFIFARANGMAPLTAGALRAGIGEETGPQVKALVEANERRVRRLVGSAQQVVERLEREESPRR